MQIAKHPFWLFNNSTNGSRTMVVNQSYTPSTVASKYFFASDVLRKAVTDDIPMSMTYPWSSELTTHAVSTYEIIAYLSINQSYSLTSVSPCLHGLDGLTYNTPSTHHAYTDSLLWSDNLLSLIAGESNLSESGHLFEYLRDISTRQWF